MPRHPICATVRLLSAFLLLPATAALADCPADFARDNRVQPDTGPYRYTEERTPMSKLDDGRWVPTLRIGSTKSVSEFVPATKAMRFTTNAPFGDDLYFLNNQAWIRASSGGEWKALLDADTLAALGTASQTYLMAQEMSNLACSTEQQAGRSVRVYRYNVPGDGLSSVTIAVTVTFDSQSGRPVSMASEGEAKKNRFTASGRFAFDPSIRIKKPF